jgi:hypothetical protein
MPYSGIHKQHRHSKTPRAKTKTKKVQLDQQADPREHQQHATDQDREGSE